MVEEMGACCGACAHGAAVERGDYVAGRRGPPVRFALDASGAPIGAVLTIDGVPHPLTRAEVVIGRASTADVVIPSPVLSRRAVALRFCPDGVSLVDLGSGCGVWVNGEQVRRAPRLLCEGDVIYLADAQLRLEGEALTVQLPAAASVEPTAVAPAWQLGLALAADDGRALARRAVWVAPGEAVRLARREGVIEALARGALGELLCTLRVSEEGRVEVTSSEGALVCTSADRLFHQGTLAEEEAIRCGAGWLYATASPASP